MTDERKLREIIEHVYQLHFHDSRVAASWLATSAMQFLDPKKMSPAMVYQAAHMQCRQTAREVLRSKFMPSDDKAPEQHTLFPMLQARYPAAHNTDGDDLVYVLLEDLSDIDVGFNVARLRKEAAAKAKHADELEAWAKRRPRPYAA